MESLKIQTFNSFDLKPKICLHYVDVIFIIWLHSKLVLKLFLNHLTSQDSNIKSTMKIEKENSLT